MTKRKADMTSTASTTFMSQLPDELVLSVLDHRFPCRQQQIRTLATLMSPNVAPCRNCIVHGTEATGKSALVDALVQSLGVRCAMVNSLECITGRHLFETTVRKVAGALELDDFTSRCESLAQLTFELSNMLKYPSRPRTSHLVLVFDAVDRQRDAPPTLLPALARLSEIIPSLTTLFIMTNPLPSCLRTSSVAYVHFPNYTKSEFIQILANHAPLPLSNTSASETCDLWTLFCGAVHDSLTQRISRTLPAFQGACTALWPHFTAPIREGNLGPKDFSKLLIAARVHFQDDSLLDPGIIQHKALACGKQGGGSVNDATTAASTSLAALLSITARILLISAYLASHNATRHDLTLFSTYHHGKRKRRGAASSVVAGQRRSKHRKIARKLLGAHAFGLERMMAIFVTVRQEWGYGDVGALSVDVGAALATLSSLRLLGRVGGAGADPLDRAGKWRVNVEWEVIRSLGRSMNVEVEEWLVE